LTARDPASTEIVEPRALPAFGVKTLQAIHRCCLCAERI
jgi:hypothetical protein